MDTSLTSQHPHISIPMAIPGDNYAALLDAGLISQPYLGTNEKDVQWVSEAQWTIERQFEVNTDQFSSRAIMLKLSRVDTLATFVVNGEVVLTCSNMFREYECDIKPYLTNGTNHISVTFDRADLEGEKRALKLPFPVPSSMGKQ